MSGDRAPAKLWGGRFEGQTDALVEQYTSSVYEDEALLPADIAASMAHARMLGERGIIPPDDAQRIIKGLKEILEEYDAGTFHLRPELEDVHMNVESRLGEKIGAAAGRLHTARSRNDQVATDFRMYVMDAAAMMAGLLLDMQESLLRLAEAHRDAIMPGYTHLQRAQPVLFAHHMLAYCSMFRRDGVRFVRVMNDAGNLPLGSGALAGLPYPIDRETVAADLGFHDIIDNSIDAVADRDFAVEFVSAAAQAMVHVSRLAEEVVLWSSAEFAFITLPDAFATGSSIMPQKKNPDVAELARGRSGRVIGSLVAMLTMLKGLPLAYNRDLQEDKPILLEAEDILASTLEVMSAMMSRIVVHEDRMRTAAGANYALATDLADYLAMKGLPFREAHEIVGRLVRHAETRGADLGELSLDEMRSFSPLFDEDARGIDVASSVRSRSSVGGTAPDRVTDALASTRASLEAMRAELADEGADA